MDQDKNPNESLGDINIELNQLKDNNNLAEEGLGFETEATPPQNDDINTEEELLDEMEKKGIPRKVVDLFEWVETLVVAVVCVITLFTFGARTSQVSGESMVPTLHDKDMLLVTRAFFNPRYGDIVVVTKPNYLNEPIIKRVIATEGQQVNIDFEQGIVYVNNIALEEPYVNSPTYLEYDINFPIIVPKGQLFVMGDNRNRSLDSRSSDIGMIEEGYILGKAFLRFAPFTDFGGLYS